MNPTRAIGEEIVMSVPRSTEIVWRILTQPDAAQLLMGPTVTTDKRSAKVTVPVGPTSMVMAASVISNVIDDDDRAIAIEMEGDLTGVLRISAVPNGTSNTDLQCAFDGTVTGQLAQLSSGLVDQVGVALSEQRAAAVTHAPVPDNSVLNLETVLKFALPGLGLVGLVWLVGFVKRTRGAGA